MGPRVVFDPKSGESGVFNGGERNVAKSWLPHGKELEIDLLLLYPIFCLRPGPFLHVQSRIYSLLHGYGYTIGLSAVLLR